ncbi:MAG: restriction endonuclease subunit S [Candidatus Scalindua sp.]|nr:restriction endonuclease subunit S [Candidatus Scalindua sp.]
MGEWKECKLGEIFDFASGLSKNKSEFGFGYNFLSFKDVFNNYFLPYNLTQLANTTGQERNRCSIRRGDIFLTRTSETQEELGMSSVALKDYPNATFNGFTKRLRPINLSLVLPEYAGFYFRSPRFRAVVTSMSSITTRASLNNGMLSDLPIIIPPMETQKAIASVLSSLDDKIDLLHRQNKTLDAMAETLFRQWFVEEAKEDWEEDSLLEVILLIGGGTPKTAIAEYWDGDIPWLAGGDIASNHKSFINHSEKSITDVGLKNSSAKLLPKYATVISARGTVGKYCLLAQPVAFSQSNYGILPNPKIPECFFFTYLLVNHVVEELQSSAYGSVFDTITTTTFKEIKVPLPTETEILRFDQLVSPYFKKMFLNKSQILTLEKLRETLLPKLMSGEVRVEYEN